MKTRDILGLLIAFVIIAATVTLFYTQLAPVPKGTGITVEIPPKMEAPLQEEASQAQMSAIKDLQDYAKPQEIRVCSGDADKGCIGKNGAFQP